MTGFDDFTKWYEGTGAKQEIHERMLDRAKTKVFPFVKGFTSDQLNSLNIYITEVSLEYSMDLLNAYHIWLENEGLLSQR